jgi:hypothetical protein
MFAILLALGMFVADLLKSRSRLEAENLFLRHQLNIALRRTPPRLRLRGSDRALLVCRRARTWHYRKTRPCIEQPDGLLSLSPFQFLPDYVINTSGCYFRKGRVMKSAKQYA